LVTQKPGKALLTKERIPLCLSIPKKLKVIELGRPSFWKRTKIVKKEPQKPKNGQSKQAFEEPSSFDRRPLCHHPFQNGRGVLVPA
jgi:hypothetical protein